MKEKRASAYVKNLNKLVRPGDTVLVQTPDANPLPVTVLNIEADIPGGALSLTLSNATVVTGNHEAIFKGLIGYADVAGVPTLVNQTPAPIANVDALEGPEEDEPDWEEEEEEWEEEEDNDRTMVPLTTTLPTATIRLPELSVRELYLGICQNAEGTDVVLLEDQPEADTDINNGVDDHGYDVDSDDKNVVCGRLSLDEFMGLFPTVILGELSNLIDEVADPQYGVVYDIAPITLTAMFDEDGKLLAPINLLQEEAE